MSYIDKIMRYKEVDTSDEFNEFEAVAQQYKKN